MQNLTRGYGRGLHRAKCVRARAKLIQVMFMSLQRAVEVYGDIFTQDKRRSGRVKSLAEAVRGMQGV